MNFLSRIRIVLCRPEGSLNIGSVCRAMKTMGIEHLTIISPEKPLIEKQIKDMAVHAYHIFENATRTEDLKSALRESVISAGITRRRGSKRKSYSLLPEEFSQKALLCKKGEISLVFGNEQHGLSDEELRECNCSVHIPSNPVCPSLNLSHAVQIMTYSLYRASEEKVGRYTPVTQDEMEPVLENINRTLDKAGFFKKPDRFNTPLFIKDILGRAMLSKNETRHLNRIFSKIQYSIKDKD